MTTLRTREPMKTNRSPWFAAAATIGAAGLLLTVAAPIAHADDGPLDTIHRATAKDRPGGCPRLYFDPALDVAAGAYARSENPADGRLDNYNGEIIQFLGSGDPLAAAINSAYRRGAGNAITNCRFTELGVGFIRHDDRSVDVVTMVFGAPAAPPPAAPAPVVAPPAAAVVPPPAAVVAPPAAPAAPTATVNADTDLYDKPSDQGGHIIGQLKQGQVVTLKINRNMKCSADAWCYLFDPTIGVAWGRDLTNN
jgi:hypothetical protein